MFGSVRHRQSVLGADLATCGDGRNGFLTGGFDAPSRSRHFLTSPGRSRDKCGTIEGSDLRLTRVRGRRTRAGDGRDRLFEGEEAVLHVMG
jgi:hypothetical protein